MSSIAEEWQNRFFKDYMEANGLVQNLRTEREKRIERQLELYEAAIGNYVPEPQPEPEMIKIKLFGRSA